MGMPLEIRRMILRELLTIDANHKTLIAPPSTCFMPRRMRRDEFHAAAVREKHTCLLHSAIMSTCKRLYEEGRAILFEDNHFVAIRGNQKLFIKVMVKWNVYTFWVPETWAGKWSRTSAAFELDHYHVSPNVTIAFKTAVDGPMRRGAPVLIPARHLSAAVLAVLGVQMTHPRTGPIELYFHSKYGKNLFGGKEPFTVEELRKKIFIWLGKYSNGFRWCWSQEALDEHEKQSRAQTEAEVFKAFQETNAYHSKRHAEENAMYKHLREFVVEMDECLDEDKQAEAFSKFQEFAHQMSAAEDKALNGSFAPSRPLPLAFIERTGQLYAYACYRVTSLANPDLLGWHKTLYLEWSIDRALERMPLWMMWSAKLHAASELLIFSDNAFSTYQFGQESAEVQRNVRKATAEAVRAALFDIIRYLDRELNCNYGHVRKLKDQPFDKDEWATSAMQS
ncbi:hypothetical protein A1O7_08999 [Cladophialophora yegresii CBS 114405]|uniref:Uncharacterized protein n=1 Tax=Cladophialophora yegresii CBS 114405 TaxID=1182544 RepID=W9VKN8_9EURO|nr:uncharacterized protein A1O7_08999 [Cladophialophora yegresii CBS 114405]EXJ56068.1 hypothetical protein A1O7_08999 [Cladophialophora yegresii CBS 114405]